MARISTDRESKASMTPKQKIRCGCLWLEISKPFVALSSDHLSDSIHIFHSEQYRRQARSILSCTTMAVPGIANRITRNSNYRFNRLTESTVHTSRCIATGVPVALHHMCAAILHPCSALCIALLRSGTLNGLADSHMFRPLPCNSLCALSVCRCALFLSLIQRVFRRREGRETKICYTQSCRWQGELGTDSGPN